MTYTSIDYALYADSGIGNKFVIYESSVRVCETGVRYATGDYMKVIRSGAQIKYYHIKASDGPLAKGTLLYTSSKTSNANTKLFLDSSFHNATFAKVTFSFKVRVILISSPMVKTPLLSAGPLPILDGMLTLLLLRVLSMTVMLLPRLVCLISG
jgi:hypothetical protein